MKTKILQLTFIGLSLFATQLSQGAQDLKILIKNPPVTPYCSHPKWIQQVLAQSVELSQSYLQDYAADFLFRLREDQSELSRLAAEELDLSHFNSLLKDFKAPVEVDYILVEKAKNKLHLLSKGRLVRSYSVALGFSPIGHKAQEGDGKTPEGVYKIEYKNPNSQFYMALKVSYPNDFDEYFAKNHKVKPGGQIMVHGFPRDEMERRKVEIVHGRVNWTEGCMGMTNSEIEEVYSLVSANTPIEICK